MPDRITNIVERATMAERLSEQFVVRPDAGETGLHDSIDRARNSTAPDDPAFARPHGPRELAGETVRRELSVGQEPDGPPALQGGIEPAAPPAQLDTRHASVSPLRAGIEPVGPPQLDTRHASETPEWTRYLRAGIEPVAPPAELGTLPFESILSPIVDAACRSLSTGETVPREALRRSLAARLSDLCAETLFVEFTVYRAIHRGASYAGFAAAMAARGLGGFFAEYPVLGRLVGQCCQSWVERMQEFLLRLESDTPELCTLFAEGRDLGRIADLQLDLSDFHDGGRTVFAVTFECGVRIVYKPRDLAIDAAYAQLVGWINRRASLKMRAPRLLNRGSHGWAEFVEHAPCADHAALHCYYRRAGMLLCVAHMLEATDLHYENLIAAGEHPIPIDLETLCQHRRRAFEESDMGGARELFETVIRTQLLPRWERGADGRVFDISGFAGTGGQEAGFQIPVWRAVNTDAMERVFVRGETAPRKNLPTLGGQAISPAEYIDEVVCGFSELYRIFMAESCDLLAAEGPLAAFATCPVRFIPRASEHYVLLQTGALKPRNLRDGGAYTRHFDLLWKAIQAEPRAAILAPMVEEEIRSLERLDLPRFTARPDQSVLSLPSGKQIEGHLLGPSIETIRARVRDADEQDLDRQTMYIRASMYTRFEARNHSRSAARTSGATGASAELTRQSLLDAAQRIALDLGRRAIRSRNGSASFIAVSGLPGQPLQLHPMGPSLYNGLAGVALFLSALTRLTGAEDERKLALATLAPIRDILHQPRTLLPPLLRDLGIGGCLGWGSLIYSLARCGTLLSRADLVEDAARFAALLDESAIAKDDQLDVISGAAGLALALLALHRDRPDARLLSLARACGRRLVEKRSACRLTGFSHGASGIAYALDRLARETGEPAFAQGAEAAIAYEASLYSPVERNWPDLREGAGGFGISWCHGAPGIALARAAMPAHCGGTELRDALATTAALGAGPIDNLCCGTFGRVEALLTAGLRLEDDTYVRQAGLLTADFLARVADGDLRWAFSGGLYAPAFFQGASGIGYQLLRVACPESIPSVLLFE